MFEAASDVSLGVGKGLGEPFLGGSGGGVCITQSLIPIWPHCFHHLHVPGDQTDVQLIYLFTCCFSGLTEWKSTGEKS